MSVRPGKHDEGEKPEIPQRTPYDPVDPDQSPVPLPPDSNPQPTAPVREPVEPTPIEDPTPPEPTRLYNYPQMGRLTVFLNHEVGEEAEAKGTTKLGCFSYRTCFCSDLTLVCKIRK